AYKEFAEPGAFEEMYCKGRLCANCGKCRDWYYTGDSKTWQWIRRAKDWDDEDRNRWFNGDYYKDFKRRDGYTCTLCLGYYFLHLDLGYGYCLCENNRVVN
ncbi:unnamed protein product, partial [Rotaria magnacalcarata]